MDQEFAQYCPTDHKREGDVRKATKGKGKESDLLANKLVVKNAKTINFITDYPTRRIQVVLKLHKSVMDIFKDVDIDVSAICYGGKQILMAPRCARAIETGYSVSEP